MIFKQICTSEKRKNVANIVGDETTRELAVIDAGFKPELILDHVEQMNGQVKLILATHSHRDHIAAAPAIAETTGAPIAAYRTAPNTDIHLEDGDVQQVGCVPIEVIHTPGHSADSVCFLVAGKKLLTGDTLYVGRTPKPGAGLARAYFDSLHNRLMKLDDGIEVWPGHTVVGAKPSSTIGHERRHNYVLQMEFADFAYNRRWDKVRKKWVIP